MALLLIGSSLLDSGTFGGFKQTDQQLVTIDEESVSVPVGYVIGEHLAFALNVIPQDYAPPQLSENIDLAFSIPGIVDNSQDNPGLSDTVLNFSIAGATLGKFGSSAVEAFGITFDNLPIGASSQAMVLKMMLQNPLFYSIR